MNTDELRQHNIELFETMLGHLGRKEFDDVARYMADDILCDWPFRPIPDMPDTMTGSKQILDFFREGMKDFSPYDYRITAIYEMKDPSVLIAEYYSDSVYYPTNRPYSNRYLGIFRFANDRITNWREYVNPETISKAMRELRA